MENCCYQGNEICSYELKDGHGVYYHDQVIALKKAAANGQLRCVECGERVYLAAGLIKEPYFSHYDLENCSYGATAESEESKKGKRLLYHLLSLSFPNQEVKVRYKMEEGFYASFYVEGKTKLAIEYHLVQLPMKLLDERLSFYKKNNMKAIMILGARQDKGMDQLNWYQEYVQKELGYCVFMDAKTETITVKRSFLCEVGRYRQRRVFEQTYAVSDLTMKEDGSFSFDFLEECKEKEQRIITSYEEKIRLEEEERKKQAAYREEQIRKQRGKEYEHFIGYLNMINFQTIPLAEGIRRDILLSCVELIRNGDTDMVSEKYLSFILEVMRNHGYQKQY